ncbi:unnamed protein product [Rotaria magnacalcarata]|uniref:Uncharacterized protein n=4 Tax=Rotaria magnacalcarata TaxID=392030 RepID=A0A816Q5F4_9BILA|nr:unnamed protein product [Rotaria magnacalcarata]CAF1960564.1 unnamed protein product [Rotaria magnacalcarata]CAF2057008.1 unnamed protein product [Rotaria magnacalcarata]CAF2107430.1 unnamed protein product [Rotaria magnacalcarata]
MDYSYKKLKDQLLSDTIPFNDRDSHEQSIRHRSLRRRRSEPSISNDVEPNNNLRNPNRLSHSNLYDQADDLIDTVLEVPTKCVEQAREVGKRVVQYVVDHSHLPHWLVDNEFLISGHRPPMPSFKECFASIFRLHTETVNIWTHLLGTLFFIIIAIYFSLRPSDEVHIEQKLIFGAFFLGAIICLLCSTLYHTLYCHSPEISKFFSKLDYCGIALLIIGSIIPLLYYQFYCEFGTKVAYLTFIGLLGTGCIVITMWDKFSSSQYRVYRALLFVTFAVFGFIPTCHYMIRFGIEHAFTGMMIIIFLFYSCIVLHMHIHTNQCKQAGAIQYLLIVASLYLIGACLYAARIPERLAPGLFDIWFQSHQLFHVFVVAAACVHYYGICVLSNNQKNFFGDCRNILGATNAPLASIIS